MEGTASSKIVGGIDVRRSSLAPRPKARVFAHSWKKSRKGCQRVRLTECKAVDNAASTLLQRRLTHLECQWARSRQRAVKHAAVGGRMTARWSGVFRRSSGNAGFRGGSESWTQKRFRTQAWQSLSARRQSPKKVFSWGCS